MTDHLARLRPGVRRQRSATWDRTGGNADFMTLPAGATAVLAEADGPGQVTHVWCTLLAPDPWWGRALVLRAFWDGEASPSVEVPLGDFFGVGNGLVAPFSSALLTCGPRDGLSLHSWFPMPFATGLRLEVENQGPLPVLALYCHVDHELWDSPDPELGRFHAWWHRERRTAPEGPAGTYVPGSNLDGRGNYLLLDTEGRGQLVGTALYVHSDLGGWYGEGDDMLWVDGEGWPPTVHGTGTEDAYGTAWSPSEAFCTPWFGQPVADRDDWAGFSSVYRWQVADPVPFTRSLRATLEHGHANDRGDDWSSVAYWYALDRPAPLPPLPPVADREPPWPTAWQDRVRRTRDLLGGLLDAQDPRGWAASAYLMWAHARRDPEAVDAALGWLAAPVQPWTPGGDARPALEAWVGRFDAVQAGAARVTVGLRLAGSPPYQVVVGDGRAVLREGSAGHERLTVAGDPGAWQDWVDGRLDGWEAVLRGRLAPSGDTDLALRLPALFPAPSDRMSGGPRSRPSTT